MSRFTFVWLGLTLLISAGCSAVPLLSMHRLKEADAQHPVGEILCVWEAAEGRGLDNLPCRGFGGQLLFFANGYKEPVKATGDVRIYVFDDIGVDGDAGKPVHQFDFPAVAWNALLKPSNLGASYQIFIPYTRKGLHGATCTLRVRFTPEGGLPVYSRMASVELAGHGTVSHPEQTEKQVVTVSSEEISHTGIQTANWTEFHGTTPDGAVIPASRVPGIPFNRGSSVQRDQQTLAGLRLAAEEASRSHPMVSPPAAESATTPPRALQLHAARPLEAAPQVSSAAESHDSSGSVPGKDRHPLADDETE